MKKIEITLTDVQINYMKSISDDLQQTLDNIYIASVKMFYPEIGDSIVEIDANTGVIAYYENAGGVQNGD